MSKVGRGRPVIDIAGKRFGKLLATRRVRHRASVAMWLCVCDCGKRCTVAGYDLRRGQTKSCGCLRGRASTTHGMSRSVEYATWRRIRVRCGDLNRHRYGGRGIRVCARWQKFENFYADMGPKPGPTYSIERIDNDRGYEPANCKWGTLAEQNSNKSNNRFLEFGGVRLTTAEWARRLGITPGAIFRRLKYGLSLDRVLTAGAL